MTSPDLDFLRHHDWHTIQCQCPHGCTRPAHYTLALHALHQCNDPALGPFGNRIELYCQRCLHNLHDVIEIKLARIPRDGPRPECETCGAPVQTVGDVLRSVRPLQQRAGRSQL